MDFFNKVSDTVIRAGKTVGQKTKDVTGVTKLSYDVHTKEEALHDRFAALGERYYEARKGEADPDEEPAFDEITALKEEISDLKGQIRALKGVDVCPKCGAEVPKDAKYCPDCGAELTPFAE